MPAGLITSVVPGGLAERVGLQPGDELLSINGHRLWDLIDVPFYGAEERLALQVRRSGREFTIGAERRYDEPLGMEFAIHATDLDMRRRVLHNPVAPDVMAQLRRLAALGIEVHAQIVVIPGLDDGPHLDRSIGDLTGLYPALRSVSVVPMGLTRYHQGGCRIHTKAEMRVVLEQVTGWQARLLPQLGIRFAYLSDEWYLRLGEKVPPAEAYDGLDLRENGVGLVRQFLEAIERKSESRITNHESQTLVTGTLFAPVLRSLVAGLPAEVVPVVNRFFGETVTVAGLLTGRDVVAQLRERDLGDVVLLPAAMFGGPEGQSLDEMRPQEIGEALGRPVLVGGHPVCRPFTACRA